jgi:hypothetical protein
VTPGRFVYTSAAQLDGRAFGATGGLCDKTATDMTNTVKWSPLEVQVDALGHETGTVPLSPAVAARATRPRRGRPDRRSDPQSTAARTSPPKQRGQRGKKD